MDDWITTGDVARRLDLSTERVRALVREGRLSTQRTPRGLMLYRVEDVERLRRERAPWPGLPPETEGQAQ